ncbi:uncharacterized protein HMPREF1541_01879 [Cyphellophora europaea CBS 101466]|uniref:BCS1 N-terminal domain-containing protein n=1 Tax=Cyphellophora europaea (strain CBS 101466) TaxID=1220924 RepID=W2S1X9_CYPE1|nr:uncharacterized protein HMPREF1541_01879 [Cyphellophora europaea CBS 101466]ETN42721.1 hypothetical protein HMPREF1541_01879 [Cyphellophora europaea CBS 101466]
MALLRNETSSPALIPDSDPSNGFLYLPPTFLDALIPGYSVLAEAVHKFAGIDISFYVSLCAFVFVLHAAWNFTVAPLRDTLIKKFSSTVVIDEYDEIFDFVLSWIRAHKLMQDLLSLRAESQGRSYDYNDDHDNMMGRDLSDGTIFNFNDWAARAPPKYEPHLSSGFFYHKGRFFRIIRDQEKVQDGHFSVMRDREKLLITVLWRSTRPIKALIEEAREFYLGKRTSHTRIYRPVAKEERSHNNEWHIVAVRPSRPIATVVLDDLPKAEILIDLNEFLHPKTARWYSNRGIPYRRGYLFHGPPGTGKSSMSFSLAGLFGLNIYCLSLSEITLTEESLIVLFNTLPRRCIVLLEDIDSAGISRPKPASKEGKGERSTERKKKKKQTKQDTSEDDVMVPGLPKKLTNAISISGLLNAIDGVASQEGRILIMTTNYPEKLDEALVRPGRVDMKIKFDLASTQQIKELFLRMYSADSVEHARQATKISQVMPHMDMRSLMEANGDLAPGSDEQAKTNRADDGTTPAEKDSITNSPNASAPLTIDADLEKLANQFSDVLPGGTFSPAEVQGYLLTRKKGPKKAVADIVAWRDEQIARKTMKALEKKQTPDTKDKSEAQSTATTSVKQTEPPADSEEDFVRSKSESSSDDSVSDGDGS